MSSHLTIVDRDIELAAQLLRDGKLVAFATETVYGLGADATNDRAVARVFEAKQRPQFNPLIVHVASIEAALALGRFDDDAATLAHALWPGPLTLVVPRRQGIPVSLLVSAGLDSIALRVPQHQIARQLLSAAALPIAAPSANPSGRVSPTLPEHVMAGLSGRIDMVLEGGGCGVGIESTIVGCLDGDPVLLRPGGVSREDIEAKLGAPLVTPTRHASLPAAPGQLVSHYAPHASVRMNAQTAREGEALLAFGPNVPHHDGIVRNLSDSGDLAEAAANLFAFLHELDAVPTRTIAAMPIPEIGLGLAINDRLRRAAAAASQ